MLDRWTAVLALLMGLTLGACPDDAPAPTGDTSLADTEDTSEADVPPADTQVPPEDTAVVPDTGEGDVTEVADEVTPPGDCVAPEVADVSGTAQLVDALGVATVTISGRESCQRGYSLATTGSLLHGLPANPRTYSEQPGWPLLRSGHDLLDALYAMTLEEVREATVDAISDGAFDEGRPTSCGEGGCFETGRLWTYVWTRDTAYATHLGLADVDPIRSRNSLAFKISDRRGGGDPQIVQDTGTGGSYPISTDRTTWAFGARAVLHQLTGEERAAFAARTWEALRNTVEHDRVVAYDPRDGLYRGETSFLDWREQTYAAWTAEHVIDIGTSKALNTNLAHLEAIELAAALADEHGDEAAKARYDGWAAELFAAIRGRFWLPDDQMLSSFIPSFLDPAPARRWDLLGSALAILRGVVDGEEARAVLGGYPTYGPGAPVIWPQQQFTRIYHNRGEWPFVTAYWLRAAAHADHDAVADQMARALIRGAAVNLSNMENFEAGTGANWLEDGAYSGPVVNSQRQLWSVAAFVSLVHQVLFGLETTPEGFTVTPYVTVGLRDDLFAGTDSIVLNDWPYRGRAITVVVHLPAPGGDGGSYEVVERRLDGDPLTGSLVTEDLLTGDRHRLDVALGPRAGATGQAMTRVSSADWRQIFGPRTPTITSVNQITGGLLLAFDLAGEDAASVTVDVYRDGARVASGLPGSTTHWSDLDVDLDRSPCYAITTTFVASQNHSQPARAFCWWGVDSDRIRAWGPGELEASGGTSSTAHGRPHIGGWGAPGDTLTVSGFVPTRTGPHLVQVTYGNGAGPINTGITCGVKRVTVTDEANDGVVGEGLLMMPHLATWERWADSDFVEVDLEAGRSYRIVLGDGPGAENMSVFEHFATYVGSGGAAPFNEVNVAEIKVLSR